MDTPDVHDDYPIVKTIVTPLLEKQRLAIYGDTLYALYPLPMTLCSDHRKTTKAKRNVNNIMMHICSKDHLQQLNSKMKLVEVCGYCHKVPKNITAHIVNLHEEEVYADTLRCVDLVDLCESIQPTQRCNQLDQTRTYGWF